MKIAIYHNLQFGGALRAVKEYIRLLSREHEIDIYQINCGIDPDSVISRKVNHIYTFKFTPFLACLFSSPYVQSPALIVDYPRLILLSRHIAGKINSGGYDLVFVHGDRWIQNPILIKYIKAPMAYYCQEPFRNLYEPIFDIERKIALWKNFAIFLLSPFHWILRYVSKIGVNSSDFILTNSSYSREYIYKTYHKWSQVSYLGIDLLTYRKLEIAKENIVISTGAINWRKKHDLAIRSVATIPESIRPALVIIAPLKGNRAYQVDLDNLANDLNVRLRIVTGIDDSTLVAYFNRALAVLCCSIMEPFGLVPLEAMACGTPAIAVNEAGYRETVKDGITGFLTERNPVDIGGRITYLFENPVEYDRMSLACRQYVADLWDWEKRYKDFKWLLKNHLHL